MLPVLVLPALALLAAGCDEDDGGSTSKIFASPPWTGDEHYSYNLLEGDDHLYGTCTLETDVESAPGKTRLARLCNDGPNHDDGSALVDSKTLQPSESQRVIADDSKGKRLVLGGLYEPTTVRLTRDDNGNKREIQRDLPKADSNSPDPGWYDDEELLWLVRGVPLKKDFEGAFMDVNVGTAQLVRVEVKVEAQERVKIAAGEFDTWRVRVRTSSVTQMVWVEVAAPHRVVKARIEALTYELVPDR